MKRVSNRFTLIEMLAVVAIASILIALITPAVQNLMFGSRVDQCVSNFKLGLEQAQSKAIASRRYVALVLPYNHENTTSATMQYNQYCKGGYRMAYVTKSGEYYNFDRWVEHQDWKNPNAGALCVDITADEPSQTSEDAWFNGVKSRVGSLGLNANFSKLSNVGNIGDDNELKDITRRLSNTANHSAVIFSPYGGIVDNIKPLYFTFTEGKVDGNKYVFDNIDNFLVLKLNPITGQVTYFDPYEEEE